MGTRQRIYIELLGPPFLAALWLAIFSSDSFEGTSEIYASIFGFLGVLMFACFFGIIPAAVYTMVMEYWFRSGWHSRRWFLTIGLSGVLGMVAGYVSARIGMGMGFLTPPDDSYLAKIGAYVGLTMGFLVGFDFKAGAASIRKMMPKYLRFLRSKAGLLSILLAMLFSLLPNCLMVSMAAVRWMWGWPAPFILVEGDVPFGTNWGFMDWFDWGGWYLRPLIDFFFWLFLLSASALVSKAISSRLKGSLCWGYLFAMFNCALLVGTYLCFYGGASNIWSSIFLSYMLKPR